MYSTGAVSSDSSSCSPAVRSHSSSLQQIRPETRQLSVDVKPPALTEKAREQSDNGGLRRRG